jgi:GNAT superfamily N-acetyltransferase
MSDAEVFGPDDVRLMQGLAQEVTARRPDLVNTDASVGQLAWVWGMGRRGADDHWRRRLWYDGTGLVGWGWADLPHRGVRSDGQSYRVDHAYLAWQVRPDRPEALDEILDWFDDQAGSAERKTGVRTADSDARRRLAAHGYRPDQNETAASGSWTQANARELGELEEPALPDGFRFRTAAEVTAEAAWQAHVDAWHPSTLTLDGLIGAQLTWPYRHDLHVLAEAPDGTLAATAIIWLDERNQTAEFEPVGTHQAYQRQGIGAALLRHGMRRARDAGATSMTVSCLGADTHQAAKGLYCSLGFREYTRDLPHLKPAPAPAQPR